MRFSLAFLYTLLGSVVLASARKAPKAPKPKQCTATFYSDAECLTVSGPVVKYGLASGLCQPLMDGEDALLGYIKYTLKGSKLTGAVFSDELCTADEAPLADAAIAGCKPSRDPAHAGLFAMVKCQPVKEPKQEKKPKKEKPIDNPEEDPENPDAPEVPEVPEVPEDEQE